MLRPLALCLLGGPALAFAPEVPDCGETQTPIADCVLKVGDGWLIFDFTGDESEARLDISQNLGGDEMLTVAEGLQIWPGAYGPQLRDIGGDARPELFVPMNFGVVNVAFRVYQPVRNEGIYSYAGEVLTVSVEGMDLRDGLIFSSERMNAYSYYETVSALTPDGLATVYGLATDFSREGSYCSLDKGAAWSAAQDAEMILAQCEEAARKVLE